MLKNTFKKKQVMRLVLTHIWLGLPSLECLTFCMITKKRHLCSVRQQRKIIFCTQDLQDRFRSLDLSTLLKLKSLAKRLWFLAGWKRIMTGRSLVRDYASMGLWLWMRTMGRPTTFSTMSGTSGRCCRRSRTWRSTRRGLSQRLGAYSGDGINQYLSY